MPTSIEALKERLYDIDALNSAAAIMSWDQQTYMPRGGAAARAEHLGILTRMLHEQFTSDETGKLIESSAKSAEGDDAAMVRRVKRDFDLATREVGSCAREQRLSGLRADAREDVRDRPPGGDVFGLQGAHVRRPPRPVRGGSHGRRCPADVRHPQGSAERACQGDCEEACPGRLGAVRQMGRAQTERIHGDDGESDRVRYGARPPGHRTAPVLYRLVGWRHPAHHPLQGVPRVSDLRLAP